MPKVCLLGLDGVSWTILERAIDMGKMPYMESILGEGVESDLETIQPPLTGPAWTSIVTGRNPGEHGVFGFVDSVSGEPYLSHDIEAETIQEALAEKGDIAVVNLPISYPPQFDGEFVGSFLSPEEDFIKPQRLGENFDFSGYKKSLTGIEKSTRVVKSAKKVAASKLDLMENILEDQDFFFLLFSAPDWVMHNYYHRMEDGEPAKAFEVFEIIDRAIELADSRSENLILMSDHGFESFERTFHPNQLLKDEGLLKTSGSMDAEWVDNRAVEAAVEAVATFSPLRKVSRSTLLALEEFVPLPENTKVRMAGMLSEGIDREKSLAFCPSSDKRAIYINDERFQGVVDEREQVVERVMDMLPENIKAHRREELYTGENIEQAPDIVIEEDGYRVSRAIYGDVFCDRSVNHHGKYGFLYAKGENIDHKAALEDPGITQIAPTIAELFGIEFDSDVKSLGIVDSEMNLSGDLLPDDF
ncbi:MAG: alkaline phosphatase family protein [Candidatus Aenigmatarchaeota archaeon]